MNKILIYLVLAISLLSCGAANSVSYSHRLLASDGCTVTYSAVQNNGRLKIVVSVESERLVFDSAPTMMLKNFKGEVLKLDGVNLQAGTAGSTGVVVNNVVISSTNLKAMAEFPIDNNNIDFFASGISKVRLSTVPFVHEKVFYNDYIGEDLYSALLKVSTSGETF